MCGFTDLFDWWEIVSVPTNNRTAHPMGIQKKEKEKRVPIF